MPLVGGIGRLVESPLNQYEPSFQWNTDLSITHLSAHSDTSQDKIKSRPHHKQLICHGFKTALTVF